MAKMGFRNMDELIGHAEASWLMILVDEPPILTNFMAIFFRKRSGFAAHCTAPTEVLRQDPALRAGPLQLEPILAPAHQLPDAGKMGASALRWRAKPMSPVFSARKSGEQEALWPRALHGTSKDD